MTDKTKQFLEEFKNLLEKYDASIESVCDVMEIYIGGTDDCDWPIEIGDTYLNDKTIDDILP
jgi:hypothetical protein